MSFRDKNEFACRSAIPGVIDRRLQVQMSLRRKSRCLAGCYGMNGCDRYEQRQSFGWLAFISCPADMRTADTLETRDTTAALVVQRCNLMQQQTTRGWVWRHIGTPRRRLLSGLKNGLVFRLTPSPFPLYIYIYVPVSPHLSPSFLPCFALYLSCIQRPRTIREMEKALVREAGEIGRAPVDMLCRPGSISTAACRILRNKTMSRDRIATYMYT